MIAWVILLNLSSEAIPRIFQIIERDGNVAACRFWHIHQAIVIMYTGSLSIVGLLNIRSILPIIVIICGLTVGPATSEKLRIAFILIWLLWEALLLPAWHDCKLPWIRSKTFWQTIVYMLPRADIRLMS